MQWHKDRMYDLVFDPDRQSLRYVVVLPKVTPEMYADFKRFVASRQSPERVEHRRIDRKKVRISTSCKNGDLSLLFVSKDGDLEYAIEKLIHLVHEAFQSFLKDGLYYEYMIKTFEIDRDQIGG